MSSLRESLLGHLYSALTRWAITLRPFGARQLSVVFHRILSGDLTLLAVLSGSVAARLSGFLEDAAHSAYLAL